MIKLLKHYLIKRANIILIATSILVLIIFISQIGENYIYAPTSIKDTAPRPINLPIGYLAWFSIILAVFAAVMEFNFKMSKISIDQMYSLPIKRHKLYIVKYLIGLTEIIIPLLFSFITMYVIIASKEHLFNLSLIIPYFICLIAVTILFYTAIVFFFTRCNSTLDGVINVILGSISLPILLHLIDSLFRIRNFSIDIEYSYFYPIINVTSIFSELINNKELRDLDINTFYLSLSFIIMTVVPMITYSLLTLKNEKSENTEYPSNSIFAYRFTIPLYLVCGISTILDNSLLIIFFVGIGGYLGFVLKNRKFKIPKTDLIILVFSITLGIILGLILSIKTSIGPIIYYTNYINYF